MSALPPLKHLPQSLAKVGDIANPESSMAVFLIEKLQRPRLLEGEAGVGKPEVAISLAKVLGAPLIRLQRCAGWGANTAVY